MLTTELLHKVINREHIETYAKEYGYLVDEEIETDAPFWTNVFGKKIFYTDVAGMREKQVKIAEKEKKEAEGVESSDQEEEEFGPDVFYQIKEFPQNEEEMLHMAQTQNYFNIVVYIKPEDHEIQAR